MKKGLELTPLLESFINEMEKGRVLRKTSIVGYKGLLKNVIDYQKNKQQTLFNN